MVITVNLFITDLMMFKDHPQCWIFLILKSASKNIILLFYLCYFYVILVQIPEKNHCFCETLRKTLF